MYFLTCVYCVKIYFLKKKKSLFRVPLGVASILLAFGSILKNKTATALTGLTQWGESIEEHEAVHGPSCAHVVWTLEVICGILSPPPHFLFGLPLVFLYVSCLACANFAATILVWVNIVLYSGTFTPFSTQQSVWSKRSHLPCTQNPPGTSITLKCDIQTSLLPQSGFPCLYSSPPASSVQSVLARWLFSDMLTSFLVRVLLFFSLPDGTLRFVSLVPSVLRWPFYPNPVMG